MKRSLAPLLLVLALPASARACGPVVTPVLMFSVLSLPLVAIAGFSLLVTIGVHDRALQRRWSAYASLLVGLTAVAELAFGAVDFATLATSRALYDLWSDFGVLLAIGLALYAPSQASRLERAVRGRHVHRLAANPLWVLVAVGGLASAMLSPGPWSWVVFAPALLIGIVTLDGLAGVPEQAPVLAFAGAAAAYVPRVPVAPPSMRPSAAPPEQMRLGQVQAGVASCPVCRSEVREAARVCVRCATPHHAECFEFNGRCAIFGCASVRAEPIAKGD